MQNTADQTTEQGVPPNTSAVEVRTGNAPQQPESQHKQPAPQPTAQEPLAQKGRLKSGCIGGFFSAINRPWILLSVPLFLAGIWLIHHPEIITNNLDKPYLLAAGPAAVASVIAGWLIIKFFAAISSWCTSAWKAFQRGRKEDANGQFFWMTIAVFMAVSVMESGQFFDTIIHHAIPGLGYATAFVIDLIAVNLMQARLEAVRMHDKKGARLYLLGVAVCASLSAFANLYTALSGFNHAVTGELPIWMNNLAPWLAMAFPAMILLMSLTADYSLDRTSTKLDANKYREQEQKRLEVLRVRRDMDKDRLALEKELAQIAQERKAAQSSRNDREFILFRLAADVFFPRKHLNTQEIMTHIHEQMRTEFHPIIQHIDAKLEYLRSVSFTNLGQIQHLNKTFGLVNSELNTLENEWQLAKNSMWTSTQIEDQIRSILASNLPPHLSGKTAKKDSNLSTNLSEKLVRNSAQMKAQKGLNFTPDATHHIAINFIKKNPQFMAQFAPLIQADPVHGYERIASLVREQGLDYGFVNGLFVSEVWALLNLEQEQHPSSKSASMTQRPTSEFHPRTPETTQRSSKKKAVREPEKRVKQPEASVNTSKPEENFHQPGERDELSNEQSSGITTNEASIEQDANTEEISAATNQTVLPITPLPDEPEMSDEQASTDPNTEEIPSNLKTNFASNSADQREQNTEELALPKAKITQKLDLTNMAENSENTPEFDTQFEASQQSKFDVNFDPNGAEIGERLAEEEGPISEHIARITDPNLEAISQENSSQFRTNFDEITTETPTDEDEIDEHLDDDEEEIEGNLEKKRGRYHVKASLVAERYQCSLEQIRLAVENEQLPANNRLAISNRTDKETDPIQEWKIKTSSLEGWVPPLLPKKRGRRPRQTKKLAEAEAIS